MTRTTRKAQAHEEGGIVATGESFEGLLPSLEMITPEVAANPDTAILVQLRALAAKIEDQSIALAEYRRMIEPLILPLLGQAEERPELTKVERRRSLDDMQFALRRLMQPEPRPADDDSPQVLQDAINEVIALRQITSDLMQASMNVYQHGLTSIRAMTEK